MKADLHMHSIDSDGLYTKEYLFQQAAKRGVDIIAITDHDVLKDVEETFKLSEMYGVKYIPAFELSTIEQEKSVHILGYFRDDSYKSEELAQYFKDIKLRREQRAKQFISNLKEFHGLNVSYDDCFKFGKGIIARPHIAKAIRVNYPEYDHNYIFQNFIGEHCLGYVPSSLLSIEEGIKLLRRHNCLVILAHPVLLKEKIRDKVLSYDFDGYEARYYQNKENDEEIYTNLAHKKDLIITAGSDFHGIPNDSKHGFIGDVVLEGKALEMFLEKISKI